MTRDDTQKTNDDRPFILLVDDDPSNVFIVILVAALRKLYQIKTAADGRTALDIVNQNPKPDLILLDVVMPEMDGYDVCQILKRNPETQNIPVIFLTSMTEHADEVYGLELGAIDYIYKPYNIKVILSRIHNHISRKLHMDRLLAHVKQADRINAPRSNGQFQLERDVNGLITFPFVEPSVFNLYGIPPDEINRSPQPLIDAIVKDDLPNLFASFNRSWKNMTDWRCEYRIYTRGAHLKLLHAESKPQILENGNIRWEGTVSDVSKHKRAEDWLWLAQQPKLAEPIVYEEAPTATPAKLEIDFIQKCLRINDQQVNLPPADLAFYIWLACRTVAKLEPVTCPPEGAPILNYAIDFLNHYRAIVGQLGDDDRVTLGLRLGMDKGYFLSRKSRVNKAIHKTLSPHAAGYYEIKCFGKRPRSVYAVTADPNQITFSANPYHGCEAIEKPEHY